MEDYKEKRPSDSSANSAVASSSSRLFSLKRGSGQSSWPPKRIENVDGYHEFAKREYHQHWKAPKQQKRDPVQQAKTFSDWYESDTGKKFIKLFGKDIAMKMGAKIIQNACEPD